ncbi:hypothetical protein, partial [Bacillus mycoides]|uniref:hypothetical protein n=1 Tax=Bacillus mycoides TaxID=1405 RepID=UPI003A808DB2
VKEQEDWESKGYLVTDTYGDDYDCGNVLELPETGNDVVKRHVKHMERCKENEKWSNKRMTGVGA